MKHQQLKTKHYQLLCEELSKYLTQLGYSEAGIKYIPSSVKEFLSHVEHQGITSITEIQPIHIRTHYEYLEQRPNSRGAGALSTMTLTHHMYAIRVLFIYLQETDQLLQNPISGLIFPRAECNPRAILTQQEIQELYQVAASARERAILALFYGCGLRRSEAQKLNLRDIHYKIGLLYVREGKGMKRRVVPMTATIAQDLKNYYLQERNPSPAERYQRNQRDKKDAEQAFLLNNHGTRMKGDSALRFINNIVRRTRIEKQVCLHSLRHCIATHLLENGTSIEYVRQFLGHEFLDTTKIYTKVNKEQLKNIHELRKIPGRTLPAGYHRRVYA